MLPYNCGMLLLAEPVSDESRRREQATVNDRLDKFPQKVKRGKRQEKSADACPVRAAAVALGRAARRAWLGIAIACRPARFHSLGTMTTEFR
jgi:hypothetical protein